MNILEICNADFLLIYNSKGGFTIPLKLHLDCNSNSFGCRLKLLSKIEDEEFSRLLFKIIMYFDAIPFDSSIKITFKVNSAQNLLFFSSKCSSEVSLKMFWKIIEFLNALSLL